MRLGIDHNPDCGCVREICWKKMRLNPKYYNMYEFITTRLSVKPGVVVEQETSLSSCKSTFQQSLSQ